MVFILALAFSGCTKSLHLYHAGDLRPLSQNAEFKRVSAEAEQYVFMGFVGNTDYANQAFENLEKECPNGEIIGIHTRHSTSHGFLSWTNKIKMTATCLE